MCAQSLGTVLAPGSGIVKADVNSLECEVWRDEALPWCNDTCARKKALDDFEKGRGPDPGPAPQRSFNDNFFKEFENRGGMSYSREVLLGAKTPGSGKFENILKLAGDGDPLNPQSRAAMNMLTRMRNQVSSRDLSLPGAYDSLRNNLRLQAGYVFGKGTGLAFPDGVIPGKQALEIKGPGDSPGVGQFEKYRDVAPGGNVLVVDGQTCDKDNILTEGGDCACKGGQSSAQIAS